MLWAETFNELLLGPGVSELFFRKPMPIQDRASSCFVLQLSCLVFAGKKKGLAPKFGDKSAPAAPAHTQTVPDFFTGRPHARHNSVATAWQECCPQWQCITSELLPEHAEKLQCRLQFTASMVAWPGLATACHACALSQEHSCTCTCSSYQSRLTHPVWTLLVRNPTQCRLS